MLIGGSGPPLMTGDLGLEVVVVGSVPESRQHLAPCRLRQEEPVGVVCGRRLLDVALTEEVGKPLLQGFEMPPQPGPDHDAVRIDGLTVLAVALPGADGA